MGNTIFGGVVDDLSVSVPLPLLPEEVVIEILARLPVISLLRFKSVSKSWRDLIQTPFFIDLHTTTTFFNSSSSCSKQLGLGGNTFILQTYVSELYKLVAGPNGWYSGRDDAFGGWVRERKMFMLSFGSGSGSNGDGEDDDDDQVVFKLDGLGFPPYYKVFPFKHFIDMVGSCHGLICLHDIKHRDVSLWNPATRQFRILPKSITIQEEEEGFDEFLYDFVAFGFDVKTKDYKVVQISCFIPTGEWRPECTCRVQVYSLSTDSWRLLEGINSLPADPWNDRSSIDDRPGLYLNGSYFFMGKKCPPKLLSNEEEEEQGELRNESLMFSFDFTKEIFTTMQLPDHDRRYSMRLTHLDDKIALFTTHIPSSRRRRNDHCDDDCGNYDIWVLNEQALAGDMNKESWAKLHSFRIEDRVARDWILPRGILNNGEFALIETRTKYHDGMLPIQKTKKKYHVGRLNELHLLNLVTKEPKKSFLISHKVSTFCIYKHSLVSIIGGNGAAAAATNTVVGGAMCGC